jgi:hypothetical protein
MGKLSKKIDDGFLKGLQGISEFGWDMENKENKLHCQKCKKYLGIIKMLLKSMGKKQGEIYTIKCRCGHINKVVKGKW